MESVKDTVRKLLAFAEDGKGASDSEIEFCLRRAAKLMDAHHLTNDDLNESAKSDEADSTMGDVAGTTSTSRLCTWEITLGNAILDLIGCVSWYIDHKPAIKRKGGIAVIDESGETKTVKMVHFYGPLAESKEAQELFEDWGATISTMAVARYGGFIRGDGAQYAHGFASALNRIAKKINAERAATVARNIPKLNGGQTTAITLTKRFDLIKTEAKDWLKKEMGVSLHSRGGRAGGYGGDYGAFSEGQKHGNAAGFGRKTARKMLGSGS